MTTETATRETATRETKATVPNDPRIKSTEKSPC